MALYAANGKRRLLQIAPISLALGGLGVALADPGADRILFFDDSGNVVDWLAIGDGLSLTGTTLRTSGLVRILHEAHSGSAISGSTSEAVMLSHALGTAALNTAGRAIRVTAFGTVAFTGSHSLTLRLYVNDGSDHQIGTGAGMTGGAGTYVGSPGTELEFAL